MSRQDITPYSIREIFDSGKYVIPIYQRNYAWKEGQIVQLIQDIYDYATSNVNQKYYIGTLVVYEREKDNEVYFETIDGQQRLTTLNILYAVLKNKYSLESELTHFKNIILAFENRITSSSALLLAYEGNFDSSIKFNTAIQDAYHIIDKELKSKFQENNTLLKTFVKYINDNVVILRVNVPRDTDLNHYFEVMNNRGEQLEKHEVLKSLLLNHLDKISDEIERERSKTLFNTIWEGCAQMERYIQYAFDKKQRTSIFGEHWDKLVIADFEDLLEIGPTDTNYENILENPDCGISIDALIADDKYDNAVNEGSAETPERFNTLINFQNFLLHCLLIMTQNRATTLDDKKLITNFDFLKNFSDSQRIAFVKEYAFCILKTKFLLDQYVIKREFLNNKEGWSLKRLYLYSETSQSYIYTFGKEDKNGNESRDIIWLLSMFHTVAPNMMYKHWLNASLRYLKNIYTASDGIEINHYKQFLENLARDLVFRRFLAREQSDYYDIIYGELNDDIDLQNVDWKKLNYHNIENNLIFNYMDYLFIKKELDKRSDLVGLNTFVRNFEFTFRSSVEHYYPQNPKDGFNKLDDDYLHSIGNLTLISHSKNSAMSNYMPKAKKEHYKDGRDADSVKQYIMFNKYPDITWGVSEIAEHKEEILRLLKDQLNHKQHDLNI